MMSHLLYAQSCTKRKPDKTDAHEALRKKIPSMLQMWFLQKCYEASVLHLAYSTPSSLVCRELRSRAVSYKELRQTPATGEKITHTLETMEPH